MRHFYALLTATDSELAAARADYLTGTLAQLTDQGLREPDLQLFIDSQRVGQCWNYLRALQAGYDSGKPLITIFEDDIVLCRNAIARIDASDVPADCAFICWCDTFLDRPRPVAKGPFVENQPKERGPDAPGYVRRVSALFYCSQALTFTRGSARTVLDSSLTRIWSAPNEGDTLIAQIFRHDYYAVHYPSIVQHIGLVSLCNPGSPLKKERVSHHFPGPDWDASQLGVFT